MRTRVAGRMALVIAVTGLVGGGLLALLLMMTVPLMRRLATPTPDRFWLVFLLTAGSPVLFVPALFAFGAVGRRGTAVFLALLAAAASRPLQAWIFAPALS